MKDLSRNVKMLCPLCGNDQFVSLDYEFDNLQDFGENARLRCSDCGSIYTKEQLIEENGEVLDNTIEEIKEDAIKEIEKELKKVFGKWKF